jgi:hypothetical protein
MGCYCRHPAPADGGPDDMACSTCQSCGRERKFMSLAGVIVLIAGAAVGGYLAWRRTTSTMFYRSPNSTIRPPEVPLEDYETWVITRRKRGRLLKTAIAAAIGAIVAAALFTMIDSGLSQR